MMVVTVMMVKSFCPFFWCKIHPFQKMMFTPPSALKVHKPYIRHENAESTFPEGLFLENQATRFVMRRDSWREVW